MTLLPASVAKNYHRLPLLPLFRWHPGAGGCTPLPVKRAALSCPTWFGETPVTSQRARKRQGDSMSGFKEPSFADRQKAAQQAKQNLLNKFRAKPGLDDPAVVQRQGRREGE